MLSKPRPHPYHTPLERLTRRPALRLTRSPFLLYKRRHPRPFTSTSLQSIGGEPTNPGSRITRELLRGTRSRGRDFDPVYKADIERGWIAERIRRQRLQKEMANKVSLGGKTATSVVPMDEKQEAMVKTLKKSIVKDGWFHERHAEQWPGQAMSLEVAEVLHAEKSLFQEVLVFRSTHHGNVLVLDGAIQCVEDDEFAYQEMIAHLAMMSHPNPKKVLVVGGGDGGVLREVLKHKCVESAELCDIDEAVIRLSKQYLPDMAVGFADPRVKVTVGDGIDYVKQRKGEYDVIITDSSDPDGPANGLFDRAYFESLHAALREGGVITTQAENQYLHMSTITSLFKLCKDIFPVVEYAYTMIPTYPSGQIGFMVCSKDKGSNPRKPLRTWESQKEVDNCKYYNKEIHAAAFVLPNFTLKALGKENV